MITRGLDWRIYKSLVGCSWSAVVKYCSKVSLMDTGSNGWSVSTVLRSSVSRSIILVLIENCPNSAQLSLFSH